MEMGATILFEKQVLRHIFYNDAIPNIGDPSGLQPSPVLGKLYIALFTTDPGYEGDITNEATYGGYERMEVSRGSAEWVEEKGTIYNRKAIEFPECTSGSETITHFGICKSKTGDDLIYSGELRNKVLISAGMKLKFVAAL